MLKKSALRPIHLVIPALIMGVLLSLIAFGARPAAAAAEVLDMQQLTNTAGWALTTARLARTDDGGVTFRDITPAGLSVDRIASVRFADSMHGWLIVGGGLVEPQPPGTEIVVYATSDGGGSWTSSVVGRTSWGGLGPVTLAVADASHALVEVWLEGSDAVGPSQVLRTTDGRNWQTVASPGRGDISLRSSGRAWATSHRGFDTSVWRSVDFGGTWINSTPTEGTSIVWNVPVFTNDNEGLLVGASRDQPQGRLIVLASHDGGVSWNSLANVANANRLTAGVPIPVSVPSDNTAVVVTPRGDRVVRAIAGQISSSTPAGLTGPVSRISFASGDSGWALNSTGPMFGRLFATVDGGKNWHQVQP